MIFEILLGLILIIGCWLIIPVIHHQPHKSPAPTTVPETFVTSSSEEIARKLSECIKIPTISPTSASPSLLTPFYDFHKVLRTLFPLVHANLEVKIIKNASLLFTWKGTNLSLKPIALCAHQDVVPPGNSNIWNLGHSAFSGDISDGKVFGRGAIDDKSSLVCIMSSVENLIASGFKPSRTVLLCFGHTEEFSATPGAEAIVDYLHEKGIELEAVIDEGGIIMYLPESLCPTKSKVCIVSVAEKGYVDFKLISSPENCSGHSSTPSQTTSIGVLSKAICCIESSHSTVSFQFVLSLMRTVFDKLSFIVKVVIAHPFVFGKLLEFVLSKNNQTNASIHSTRAITIINGGEAHNVLPVSSYANVNVRIIPGSTVEDELETLKKQTSHIPGISIEIDQTHLQSNPTPASPTKGCWIWNAIEKCFSATHPGVPVAPFVCLGATDSRHYRRICKNVYMLLPYSDDSDSAKTAHGANESIPMEALPTMVKWYTHFIVFTSSNSSKE